MGTYKKWLSKEKCERKTKFNSNWNERYFFTNSNGKPQCLVRLQVISVPKGKSFDIKTITVPNARKHMGNTTNILGKQFWNNWRVTNLQPWGPTGQLPAFMKLCTENVLPMFVRSERAFSIMTCMKSDTNGMADETSMPPCACWLQKLKRTLTL